MDIPPIHGWKISIGEMQQLEGFTYQLEGPSSIGLDLKLAKLALRDSPRSP